MELLLLRLVGPNVLGAAGPRREAGENLRKRDAAALGDLRGPLVGDVLADRLDRPERRASRGPDRGGRWRAGRRRTT